MDPAARILDANANRAAEALRTLEDVARFALADAELTARLKGFRHGLRSALDGAMPGRLIANREVASDVGTDIAGEGEYVRRGLADVASASANRLAEALRSLEEISKTFDPPLASAIERIRYASYDVAAQVVRRAPGARREQWRVSVILTESQCALPWEEVARRSIDGGAECIQLREKSLDGGALVERAARLVALARAAGARVIVNDRADVAGAAGADGVHLGQSDLTVEDVRSMFGRRLIVGVSTHDEGEAHRAHTVGADYCGVGAMFPSATQPSARVAGPEFLARFVTAHPSLPHLAIGGITPENVESLVRVGCRGVAVSASVCGSDRPEKVVAELVAAIDAGAVREPAEAAR